MIRSVIIFPMLTPDPLYEGEFDMSSSLDMMRMRLYRSFRVVEFAVVPDQLEVIQDLLDVVVSGSFLQLLEDCTQIHWSFDDVRVIEEVVRYESGI